MTTTADELDLMRAATRHALETESPDQVPSAMLELGWFDFLEVQPSDAVTIVAEERGGSAPKPDPSTWPCSTPPG